MTGLRVLRYGSRAVLVEVDDLPQVHDLYEALRRNPPQGATELVPAARTVLVRYDPMRTDNDRLSTDITRIAGATGSPAPGPVGPGADTIEIPVRYDGPDLADVAKMGGLSEPEVVARHTAGEYTVAFCGFAPGFGYLTGLDPALRLGRRDVPRTRVPAGAVALADEFTGVYPRESPGGWHIIGHTGLRIWDVERDPPALLVPGARVRFIEAGS
jgi:KipI family sensor histidine kinase inhibitor